MNSAIVIPAHNQIDPVLIVRAPSLREIAIVNRSLVMRVVAVWACTILLLYAVGWLVAWVRRGFKP